LDTLPPRKETEKYHKERDQQSVPHAALGY
jgi:hypothetical protein